MTLIVVLDIFGNTAALRLFTSPISPFYKELTVVEPYGDENIHFNNEANAYQHFQQICGIEKLTELLETEVKKSSRLEVNTSLLLIPSQFKLKATDC